MLGIILANDGTPAPLGPFIGLLFLVSFAGLAGLAGLGLGTLGLNLSGTDVLGIMFENRPRTDDMSGPLLFVGGLRPAC